MVLNTTVAVKIPRAEGRLGARLMREGVLLGRLRHPNVLPVFDVIDSEAGSALIMRHVPGSRGLQDLYGAGAPLRAGLAQSIGRQLLDAVSAAHDLGIHHRDLKPENILVERTALGPHIWVCDFGLASDPAATVRTQAHLVVGSPPYMAPEQYDGLRATDALSDVFSVSAILYELVTGVRAFDGASVPAVRQKIRAGHYVDPLEVRPDLPLAMVRAIRWGLQPSRARRAPTVHALMQHWTRAHTPRPALRRTSIDDMLGRQSELSSALDLLASGARILNIRGLPGIGKTLFARRLARSHRPGGAIVEVDLRQVADAEWLRRAIAHKAGISPAARLQTIMADIDVLVLDGYAWSNDATIARVLELVSQFESLTVLVVGASLNFAGVSSVMSLQPLSRSKSIRLLRARSLALQAASDEDVGAVAAPCRGHPLALNLAAQQAARLPARHLARLLEGRAMDLGYQDSSSERQVSVRDLFEKHWEDLQPPDRTVLSVLAHFEAPFTRAMAIRALMEGAPRSVSPLRGLRVASIGEWEGREAALAQLVEAGARLVGPTEAHDVMVLGPEVEVADSARTHRVAEGASPSERALGLRAAVAELMGRLPQADIDRLVGASFLTPVVRRPLEWLQVFPLFGPLARLHLPSNVTKAVEQSVANLVSTAIITVIYERLIDDEESFASIVDDILRGAASAAISLVEAGESERSAHTLGSAAELARRYLRLGLLKSAVEQCLAVTEPRSLAMSQCAALQCALEERGVLSEPRLTHLRRWRSDAPSGVEALTAADVMVTAAEQEESPELQLQLCREAVALVIESVEGPRQADLLLRAGQLALSLEEKMEGRAFVNRATRLALQQGRRVLVTYIQRAVR